MTDFLKNIPMQLQQCEPYQPGKTVAELKQMYGLDTVINLSNNENPLGASPRVKEAITHYLDNIAHYPEDAATELRQKLALLNNVAVEQIIFGSGSSEILEMLIRVFMHGKGELIVSQHAYYHYQFLARAANCSTTIITEHNYQTDLDAMLAAIDENTRLIVIANPNNPTGTWLSADALTHFISKVPPHVVVVIDEAYTEYMNEPGFKSMMALLPDCPNLIVVRTLSKAYGLAGLRFGYCVSSKEITQLLNRIRKPFNVANIALIAASAALDDTSHLQKVLAENEHGIQQLSDFFHSMHLSMIAQSCNFITVDFGDKALEISEALLQRGVMVRTLAGYNMLQHLRLSVGTQKENAILIKHLTELLTEPN